MPIRPVRKRIVLIFGTRPEAIKMAPVYKALSQNDDLFDVRVLVTAQHREMLDQVLDWFSIVPDFDLDLMRHEQTLTELTARILMAVEAVLKREKADLVLVHGDTTTTLAASLAAFYLRIPIGHVEAGLRTGCKYAPFPEEMNRRLTDAIADWHFAPTVEAQENLLREGIVVGRTMVTGNTVIDALLQTVSNSSESLPELVRSIPKGRRIILLTTHRRENWGEPLRAVYQSLKRVVEECPDLEVVFPVHHNPAVRSTARDLLGGVERIHLCDPLDYPSFAVLMSRTHLVLTDSGGIQEEAPALGVPVLVLRETTERPEAVRAGTVKLVGTDFDRIYHTVMELLQNDASYRAMAGAVNPYGDGRAAGRIVEFLKWKYGLINHPPEPFMPKA
ncbi:MAG TPA: UDP-N-acetylglucosamine 2-epimerase (non-hydrolyzing) [Bacillota bacterium]|nr:UDP-N-acetylglucosamine 2-epimerase (non-hydrolyzing) [Bacillota bacterium]